MKILLISTNTASSPYPVFPLGCGIIASVLTNAGHDVRLFDVLAELADSTEAEMFEKLICEFSRFSPGLVGISIRNIDNVNILEEEIFLEIPKKVIETLRAIMPGIPVMLGGSGFSIMPERILAYTEADYGIAGEGERSVLDLVNTIAAGKIPEQKIIRSSDDGLTGNEIKGAEYFADNAKSSKSLSGFYTKSGSILPLQTKRGCLNNCVYCTYPFLEGRKLRNRDAGDVVDEMKMLTEEHGADFIFFTDSVFNDADGQYLKIIEAIEKSRLDIPWTAFFQPDPKLNPQIVERLIASGLHSVELGPDATSNTTLKAIGKKFNFDDVIKCNELFADYNIAVANYFMMGGPGETEETAGEGVENIRKLNMSVSFVFLGIRILSGTPLYKIALRENIINEDTDLLHPTYYFSPKLEREWLEKYLDSTLSKIKHCVYPPNSMDSGIQILRKMGYRGNLWEMMVKDSKRLEKND